VSPVKKSMGTRQITISEDNGYARRVDMENFRAQRVYSVGIPSGHNIYHGYDFLFFESAENDPISSDSEPIKPPQISGQRFYIFMVHGIFTIAQNQKLFLEPLL